MDEGARLESERLMEFRLGKSARPRMFSSSNPEPPAWLAESPFLEFFALILERRGAEELCKGILEGVGFAAERETRLDSLEAFSLCF